MPAIGTGVSTAKGGGQSWSSYWIPRKPSNLSAEVISENEVDIIWDDGVQVADGLKAYVSTDGGSTYVLKKTIPHGQGSARLSGLLATTIYTIKLVAYKGANESDPITTTAVTINSALVDGWSFNQNNVSWLNHCVATIPFNVGFHCAKYYNGKTYVVYSGFVEAAHIICYNHSTKIWSSPVKIGANPLPNDHTHGEPSLLIDSTGYLHVWWGAHNTACKYSKSTNPEDITAWTAMTDFATGTYHQPIQFSTGRIYVFYRSETAPNCYWSYMTSDDGGANWSAATALSHDFAYLQFKKGVGDTIHVGIVGHNTTAIARTHAYYLFFDGTNWKDVAENNLTLPLDYATHSAQLLVRNSDTNWIPLVMPYFDSNNNPYVVYSEGTTAEEFTTYNHKFAKYSGGAWNNISIGASSRSWRNFINTLDVQAGGVIETYVVVSETDDVTGGNVEKWKSIDSGSTWSKVKVVREGLFNYPVVVDNYNNDIKVIFASFGTEDTRYNQALYAYSDSGFAKGLSASGLNVPSKRLKNQIIISGATLTNGVANKLLTFGGNPQYASISDQDELSFTGGSPDLPFSISFILKISNPATTNQWVIWKGLNTTKQEYRCRISANVIGFWVSGAGSTPYIGRTAPYTSTNEVKVIITYDGSGTVGGIKIYLNNVQADDTNSTSGTYAGMTADSAGVYVGANQPLSQFMIGSIGELRFFNKVLLEAERGLVQSGDARW